MGLALLEGGETQQQVGTDGFVFMRLGGMGIKKWWCSLFMGRRNQEHLEVLEMVIKMMERRRMLWP